MDERAVPRPSRVELRGRHVLLRPVAAELDAEPLYAVSHPPEGDPSMWRYLLEGPYPSVEAMRERLVWAERVDDPLSLTIVRRSSGRPEGAASYMRITPEHAVVEIGNIWFSARLQRTAAATEAIFLLARHAFNDLGYRRLEWKCDAVNEPSRRAAARFGFTFEGIFRKHMVVKGRNRDTAWYSIIDEEWPAVRAGFLAWLDEHNFDSEGRQRRRLGDLIAWARATGERGE